MFTPIFIAGTAVGVPLGFLVGSIFTRKIMAPDYCPRCLQHKEWLKDLKEDDSRRSIEEKSESRHFYWRRKNKSKEG